MQISLGWFSKNRPEIYYYYYYYHYYYYYYYYYYYFQLIQVVFARAILLSSRAFSFIYSFY